MARPQGVTIREYPAAETARRLKIEYLFSVSFPLVGNPSDLFGSARKILDKPASGGQARMIEIWNCGRDRRV